MMRQAVGRDPVWPECMPGAPGVESGEGAPAPQDQEVGAAA
jgi:hypothetical protein